MRMQKLEMFDKIDDLPTKNERALELLTRINTLWDENSWLAGETHQTRHQRLSFEVQQMLVEFAVNSPDTLEELLNDEICLNRLIEIVCSSEES